MGKKSSIGTKLHGGLSLATPILIERQNWRSIGIISRTETRFETGERKRERGERERETLRSIDGGATYGFAPDSPRFCFVAVFRPASVQNLLSAHRDTHRATALFSPVTAFCPSMNERERLFSPLESNESCDEAPVIVTKKPILSQSRVTGLETLDALEIVLPIPLVHRPCNRYSIFRLAAPRMLNTTIRYTRARVCIRFQKKRIP